MVRAGQVPNWGVRARAPLRLGLAGVAIVLLTLG